MGNARSNEIQDPVPDVFVRELCKKDSTLFEAWQMFLSDTTNGTPALVRYCFHLFQRPNVPLRTISESAPQIMSPPKFFNVGLNVYSNTFKSLANYFATEQHEVNHSYMILQDARKNIVTVELYKPKKFTFEIELSEPGKELDMFQKQVAGTIEDVDLKNALIQSPNAVDISVHYDEVVPPMVVDSSKLKNRFEEIASAFKELAQERDLPTDRSIDEHLKTLFDYVSEYDRLDIGTFIEYWRDKDIADEWTRTLVYVIPAGGRRATLPLFLELGPKSIFRCPLSVSPISSRHGRRSTSEREEPTIGSQFSRAAGANGMARSIQKASPSISLLSHGTRSVDW